MVFYNFKINKIYKREREMNIFDREREIKIWIFFCGFFLERWGDVSSNGVFMVKVS